MSDLLIKSLNNDLKNEYKHMHFYLQSAILIEGLHREELREFLLKKAKEEMEHVIAFADVIVGLGGVPTTEINPYPDLYKPEQILSYALSMEEEVVKNYITRINEAIGVSGVNGKFIEVFLEDQLLDSKKDIDNLKKLLKN